MLFVIFTLCNLNLLWNIVDSRKKLLPEAVPTLNLPSKSVESRPVLLTPRRVLQKEASATETREVPKYKDLTSFKKRLEKLKLEGWVSEIKEEEVCIKYFDLRGSPCNNRPLKFREITEFFHTFCVKELIHEINKKRGFGVVVSF